MKTSKEGDKQVLLTFPYDQALHLLSHENPPKQINDPNNFFVVVLNLPLA